jgi:hypothetical protein|tara:strand:+ start:1963 stop:2217 length:255 start_codon:yes stop_codon:yes gene_type:complete
MRPTLNTLQNDQLQNYVAACLVVRDLKANPPGAADSLLCGSVAQYAREYWARRSDAEEHQRDMYHAFVSSLEWAADSASEVPRG